MEGIEPSDDCLTYHMIEGPTNWRIEHPKIDKNIEDTIEDVADGKLSLDQFIDRCARYTTELRVLQKAGAISRRARQNYELILNLVYVELQDKGEE